MQNKSWLRSFVLLAAVAIAIPAFAKPMSKSLPLNHNVHVGKYDVKAGDYNVLIDGNHLTLKKNNKVVAEADGTFSFKSLGPGKYKVRAWSEQSAEAKTTEIVLKAGANETTIDLMGGAVQGPSEDKFGAARQ